MIRFWARFRGTPLGELLTGTAHEAHPADLGSSPGQRFAGQSVLVVHVALERAATVRVTFDTAGKPCVGGIRNIKQRSTPEFGQTVRAEAAAIQARWAFVVFATGWQALLGQRAARADVHESGPSFARHRLMFETPEAVAPRAQVDRVYTAVDHPTLDRSVVFSLKRSEVETITGELTRCGLGLAGIKIGVAAQLEAWLAAEGEPGLERDLLLTDGLSALLINTEQRDFSPPAAGGVEAEQPRQSVQRPSAIEEDIARFVAANSGRRLAFVGPEELWSNLRQASADLDVTRAAGGDAHDSQAAALASSAHHDLNIEAKEVRPPLGRSVRRITLGYAVAVLSLAALAGANAITALRLGVESYRLETEVARCAAASVSHATAIGKLASDYQDVSRWRNWVSANYHAQRFCARVMREVPAAAALDKLQVEMRDGQLFLTYVVLGDQDLQLETHRSMERALTELRYKIGGEELPTLTSAGSRAVQYRLHLIAPDAADASS